MMAQRVKPENVNSSFFDGYYKDVWRHIFPEKTTQAEADFIIEECRLTEKSSVLDILCGYGRHSLMLARKGIRVTAIDNLPEYINEIKETAGKENLEVDAVCADIFEAGLQGTFDAVICMGNSLQFFNEEETAELLRNISAWLKPGGKFIINTWSIAEIAIKNFRDKSWNRVDDLLFLTECRFLLRPARIETDCIMIKDSGEREEKKGIDYIYSISELEKIFQRTGFTIQEIYSIPGKKIFTLGDPRAYIVLSKNGE